MSILASLISNYGDDALRAATNQVDDVARAAAKTAAKKVSKAAANYADDAVRATGNQLDDVVRAAANSTDDVEILPNTLNSLLNPSSQAFPTVDGAYFADTFNPTSLTLARGNADTDTVAALKQAILNNEDITPIAAIRTPDGKLSVLDGHHRLEAFRQTGRRPTVKEFLPSEKSQAYDFASIYEKSKK